MNGDVVRVAVTPRSLGNLLRGEQACEEAGRKGEDEGRGRSRRKVSIL